MELAQVGQTYTYNELLTQKNSLLTEIQIVEKTILDLLVESINSEFKNNGGNITVNGYELYINIQSYDVKVDVTLDKVIFSYNKTITPKKQKDKIPLKTQILPFFSKTIIWYPEKQSYDDFSKIYLTKILSTKSLKF
jgi:hypothetical protein